MEDLSGAQARIPACVNNFAPCAYLGVLAAFGTDRRAVLKEDLAEGGSKALGILFRHAA
jgi:hypothetical protein